MRCEKAGRMMSARLDDRLDHTDMLRLQDHLASCSACQARWQQMKALDLLFRSAPMSTAPPHLHVRVTSRIERQEQARRAIAGGLALAVGTTALAVLVLIPLVVTVVDNLAVAAILLTGGLETITQLLALLDAVSRTALILLNQFSVPFAVLSATSLLVALALNGLWIATMRRLQAAHR